MWQTVSDLSKQKLGTPLVPGCFRQMCVLCVCNNELAVRWADASVALLVALDQSCDEVEQAWRGYGAATWAVWATGWEFLTMRSCQGCGVDAKIIHLLWCCGNVGCDCRVISIFTGNIDTHTRTHTRKHTQAHACIPFSATLLLSQYCESHLH